jgi:hypothetical protein
VVVRVEPLLLPADANVGGRPTAAAEAGEAGRLGEDDTPYGTLEEHYQMGLPQPFSSYSPCGCGSHRLQ